VAAPQPQAQAQESTAGHIAGGSTNEIHALKGQNVRVVNSHWLISSTVQWSRAICSAVKQ